MGETRSLFSNCPENQPAQLLRHSGSNGPKLALENASKNAVFRTCTVYLSWEQPNRLMSTMHSHHECLWEGCARECGKQASGEISWERGSRSGREIERERGLLVPSRSREFTYTRYRMPLRLTSFLYPSRALAQMKLTIFYLSFSASPSLYKRFFSMHVFPLLNLYLITLHESAPIRTNIFCQKRPALTPGLICQALSVSGHC